MTDNSQDFDATIDWYNKNAAQYIDTGKNLVNTALLERFMQRLKPGARVLDAGCAGGRDSRIFKDHGFEPIGIDLSHEFIEQAKKNHPDIEFVEGDMRDMPFADNYFAGIWANASLVHLPEIKDVRRVLLEFYRVLQPGGVVHISVKEQLDEHKTAKKAHVFSGEFRRFFRFYTKDELEGYLREAGFKIVSLENEQDGKSTRSDVKWIVALVEKN